MGKRSGIFFAIAAVIMTVIIWGNPVTRFRAALLPETPVITPANLSFADLELNVESERLMAHVNAVSQL